MKPDDQHLIILPGVDGYSICKSSLGLNVKTKHYQPKHAIGKLLQTRPAQGVKPNDGEGFPCGRKQESATFTRFLMVLFKKLGIGGLTLQKKDAELILARGCESQ